MHVNAQTPRLLQPDSYQRAAVQKRIAHISVALGHPRLTPGQRTSIIRELKSLERMLAGNDSGE
jgi:hypothetical protein